MSTRGARVLAAVALLLAAALPAAATRAKAPMRLLAGPRATAKGTRPLAGNTLKGRVFVFVSRSRGARSAAFYLDARPTRHSHPAGRARARRGRLAPFGLRTTRLLDGQHTLWVKVKLARRTALIHAAFFVSNHKLTARELILAAYRRHKINYGKALLFRFYAMWRDRRLPRKYWGAGGGEDNGLYAEAEATVASRKLSTAAAKQLRPFLARPADPRSVFNRRLGKARARASAASTCGQWDSVDNGKVRVWAKTSDAGRAAKQRRVMSLATDVLKRESDFGSPISDSGFAHGCSNPDGDVDIYLVKWFQDYPRPGIGFGKRSDEYKVLGALVPELRLTNDDPATCPGFVLINESELGNLEPELVHELFHLLQNAQNCRKVAGHSWFVEASATWAIGHYSHGSEASNIQGGWYSPFQSDVRSLDEYGGDPQSDASYENFIWPLFMAQESGAGIIKTAWDALASATDQNDVLRKLDSVFAFKDHYRDFAVRDLNEDYDGTRFQDVAPKLPGDKPTKRKDMADAFTLDNTSGQDEDHAIAKPGNLDFRYLEIDLPDKNTVRYAKLDFSKLGADIDVDALVRVAGKSGFERRKLDDGKLEFCRDNPGDDIHDMLIVVSNHSLNRQAPSQGQFSYRTSSQCGKAQLSGKLTFTSDASEHDDYQDIEGHWSGSVMIDETADLKNDEFDDGSTAQLSGTTQGDEHGCSGNYPCQPWSVTFDGSYRGQEPDANQSVGSPLLATWYTDPTGPGGPPHVMVQFSLWAPGTEHLHVTGQMPGGACSYAPGDYTENPAAAWISQAITIPLPPSGGSTTIAVDDITSFLGADPCEEGTYYQTHLHGTLTLTTP